MSTQIKAVTFDLWDTIVDDDSDEPKRLAQGLRPKPEERRHLLWEALTRHQEIAIEDVTAAFDAADAAFNKAWKGHSITWKIGDRLARALMELGRTLPDEELAKLADDLGRMEVDIPPDPIDGIADALEELSRRYKLCIVSDAIVTPADGLRRMLDGHGLKQYFQGFAFSDEAGHSKPHADMFNSAARQLGVEVTEMIHVGDRDHNDIKGPQALGMKAVLFTATRDDDKDSTSADAICERAGDLPAMINGLAS
ncbi:MAG: HAD family hydrolase [Proteobacteria bacterium]|nr:HAD family hydrolase [Pseudomonadota bacterium]